MQSNRTLAPVCTALATIAMTLTLASAAWAQSTYKILHAFTNPADGQQLLNLVLDAAGDLYGTTYTGGAYGYGTVFKLTPNPNGAWIETVIHSFSGPDGYWPQGNLVFDAAGNLYGATQYGGDPGITCEWGYSYGCGTVFKIAQNPDRSWTESVLAAFEGGNGSSTDGWDLLGGLAFDTAGNLYGTTASGGSLRDGYGYGTVFELTPMSDGSWTRSTIHVFDATDGWYPWGTTPIMDAAGDLYGTTSYGGAAGCATGQGCGVVWEMMPNPDGSWAEKVLHKFQSTGNEGANPSCWLVLDAAGNLYGTTFYGGAFGYGNVFELMPSPSGAWTEKVLHQFAGGKDGANPFAGLTFDAVGNLYGTATAGGTHGYGVVFELSPKSGGWSERILHAFQGEGQSPYPGVILDSAGNLYGSTWAGNGNGGIVFEITP